MYDVNNDDDLKRIIEEVEQEKGGKLGFSYQAITFDDDPEEKIYIVLIKTYDYDSEIRDWEIIQGRQRAYDRLKGLISDEIIDPNNSFIIACDLDKSNPDNFNATPKSKPITVFRFMKVMLEENKVLDDKEGFDINEYDSNSYDYLNHGVNVYEAKRPDKTILDEIF